MTRPVAFGLNVDPNTGGLAIDVLSGGRFELGLGAGGFHDAIAGVGGPRRTVAEARQALSEALASD